MFVGGRACARVWWDGGVCVGDLHHSLQRGVHEVLGSGSLGLPFGLLGLSMPPPPSISRAIGSVNATPTPSHPPPAQTMPQPMPRAQEAECFKAAAALDTHKALVHIFFAQRSTKRIKGGPGAGGGGCLCVVG